MTVASTRIALKLEYNGAAFSGWQKQLSPALATVQRNLETALGKIADCNINVVCAGRTDSNVHATSQVVHFDTPVDRGPKAWRDGVNSLVGDSIRVTDSAVVDEGFHARFSATFRRYNYIIHQRKTRSPFLATLATHCTKNLDLVAMQEAAQHLLGEQDFSAFRAAGCQSRTSMRNILFASFAHSGDKIVFDVQANAFLQHMVRNIMGSLLEIGQGNQSSDWIGQLLAGKDRTKSAMTAPPQGLYLVEVGYPEPYKALGQKVLPAILCATQ
ncbi:MAG: tRNA pseudouridine38-40 synthase [Pseudohongiellaceae bacterium]|jgi:tRNA pseudouridine38-40 synthase